MKEVSFMDLGGNEVSEQYNNNVNHNNIFSFSFSF